MPTLWLDQFPAHRQPIIRAWFAAVRIPGQTPDELLQRVRATVAHRLDGGPARDTEALCRRVLLALVHHRDGARQFAQTLLGTDPEAP